MPTDVKAGVSVIVLVVAAILAWWHGSPIRPDYATAVIVTAIFMVIAMWIFPEAGVKKSKAK
jgi:membrane protein YdbS with pleckstrin-like domain